MADGSMGAPTPRRSIKELRFVVVGGYVADCFVATSRLPAWGDNYQARSIRTSPGGKALNQAVALARLGAQVTAVGGVGEDPLGRDILAALTREGIDVSFVRTHENAASAICVCFVGDDGQTAFVWHIDDDVAVTPDTVRAAEVAIRSADAVLVTFELPVPAIRETINVAGRHGVRVCVQPAPPLADPAAAASLPWDQVDVLVPNETEARALLNVGQAGELAVDDLAEAVATELGVPIVVVTLGESGCVTHAAGVTHLYPARKTAIVDTTGASDAFTATFAAHITAGMPVAEAIDAAQSAAAWTIRHIGGQESMPSAASEPGAAGSRPSPRSTRLPLWPMRSASVPWRASHQTGRGSPRPDRGPAHRYSPRRHHADTTRDVRVKQCPPRLGGTVRFSSEPTDSQSRGRWLPPLRAGAPTTQEATDGC